MAQGWTGRWNSLRIGAWLAIVVVGVALYAAIPMNDTLGQDGGLGEEALIRFEGLEGPSTARGYEGWSELLALQQGVVVPIDMRRMQARGAVTYSPLMVVKDIDSISPELMQTMSSGRFIPSVEIHLRETDPESGNMETFYQITLQDVQIASYDLAGTLDVAGAVPTEEIELAYQSIEVRYSRGGQESEFRWDVQSGSTR